MIKLNKGRELIQVNFNGGTVTGFFAIEKLGKAVYVRIGKMIIKFYSVKL